MGFSWHMGYTQRKKSGGLRSTLIREMALSTLFCPLKPLPSPLDASYHPECVSDMSVYDRETLPSHILANSQHVPSYSELLTFLSSAPIWTVFDIGSDSLYESLFSDYFTSR